jgi:hypothetical protein
MLNRSSTSRVPDGQQRAYLRDLSFLAREIATSSDPRVIAGGLEVLALQAECFPRRTGGEVNTVAALRPIPKPAPPLVAPKTQPCVAIDRLACRCAVCHGLIAGQVHIDSSTLKLTCSVCCGICNRKRGRP